MNADETVRPPCANGGFVCMAEDAFKDLLDQSAQRGAAAALAELGLKPDDADSAAMDIRDLRSFLRAWRQAKGEALKGLFFLAFRGLNFIMLVGVIYTILNGPQWLSSMLKSKMP